jgi:hypothetical protein
MSPARLRRRIAQLELGQDTDVSGLPTLGDLIAVHLAGSGLSITALASTWGMRLPALRQVISGANLPAAQRIDVWADRLEWPADVLRRRLACEAQARAEAA